MSRRVLVTSALPYANGPIHFGHIVGAYLPADVYTRFRRMLGDDVHYVCGTDEHGVAITLKAEQAGQSYEEYVDRWHDVIAQSLRRLGIEFDTFTGTAHHRNPYHRELAQQFFLDLQRNGYLGRKTEEQFYSETTGRFLPDRYVVGTCYHCGHDQARGDECPGCGRYLEAQRLQDPRSTLDGSTPVLKPTTHWYLDLARARDEWLRDWFESKSDQWKPNVRNFVRADLAELRERAITRDLPWGVPVPTDGAGDEAAGKVLYVWFDAPIGYLSISKQYWTGQGRPERFEEFWKSPDTQLYHFIGKDNITFHAVVFPAMLHGTGAGWVLPENVPANEFFNLEGRKFNTSSGWYVPADSVRDDPTDALRYALCAMMPETADSEWTWEEYRAHVNDELADNLGNFATRTLRFIERFFDGEIPALDALDDRDRELAATAASARDELVEHLHAFRFRRACQALMALGGACNRYYDQNEPWRTVKDPATRPRAARVMRVCVEMLRSLAVLAAPIMPETAATLLRSIGLADSTPHFDAVGDLPAADGLPAGPVRGAPLTTAFPTFTDAKGREKAALFVKIPEERVDAELAKLRAHADAEPAETASGEPAVEHEPPAEQIAFDTFAAVDMRAGTVTAAEKHPKADRLLVLRVDLGFETRTVCAGVAAAYAPEELVGRRVVAVANLAPRKLRGIESQGMLLATEDRDGKPRFLTPDPGTPDGARVT